MKGTELIKILEETFPLQFAAGWDNSGLQAGSRNWEVSKVYIALDATEQVIRHAAQCKADMLLTHHPLLMSGMKSITEDDLTGRKVIQLIEKRIITYAMHTNYDVVRMGKICAERLNLKDIQILDEEEGFGKTGLSPKSMTLGEWTEIIKQAFQLEKVKVFGDLNRKIEKIALCPGSGKSMIPAALSCGADLFITGDIGHHDGIDAAEQRLCIVDAGHYGLEHVFIRDMQEFLEKRNLQVVTEPIKSPFLYC